jgi:methionine synthase II (cobalamin-independent)
MQRDLPPFRPFAPITLVRYCSRFRSNKRAPSMWPDNYPQPALTAIEDAEIKKIIAKQETIGLRSVTNGELRRAYWHFDFLAGLDGVEMVEAQGIKFAGVTSKAEAPYVKGKLGSHQSRQAGRFLPKGKTVVLGLITSKTGAIEIKDFIKRRIEDASKYTPLEQLCLSPQCGFASTEDGNVIAEDEQWTKLRLVTELADEVWGR